MSFENKPVVPETSLNFNDGLFPLAPGQSPLAVPTPTSTDAVARPQSALNFAPESSDESFFLDEASSLSTGIQTQADSQAVPNPSVPIDQLKVLRELQHITSGGQLSGRSSSSKDEIAAVLEGFARVLREGDIDVFADVKYKDRSDEIMHLKELLLEAQETIIGLLNDRVFDRAKLAKMELEAHLMPDLQAQATRAMGLAMRSEEVQRELSQVRNEVERLRTAYVRQEQNRTGFMAWLFGKKPNLFK